MFKEAAVASNKLLVDIYNKLITVIIWYNKGNLI